MADLVIVPPPTTPIYRIARGPAEPFASPDWMFAHDDGTFGNRFDDPSARQRKRPEERFRVIYCASQRAAAFGETLARFRPSIALLSALKEIEDEESIETALAGAIDSELSTRGLIPGDWRLRRRIGQTILDPSLVFVDVAAAKSMQYLRLALPQLVSELGISDVDLSSLTSQQRRFTQCCARYIYEQLNKSGRPLFAGIRYLSRLKPEWECWAIFDDRFRHAPNMPGFSASIYADDPDLNAVASLFGLTIEVLSGTYLRP